MNLILRWLLASLALLITVHLVPGISFVGSPVWILAGALALGLLNLLARPALLLLRVLTFPLSCLTFGLWTFILSLFVNILVFYFVGSLEWGFRVAGFGAAVLGAVVMSVLNTLLTGIFHFGSGRPPR
jgi:putative membrane protein